MDILRDAWIPTDKGILSPIDALIQARRLTWPRGDWNGATMLLLHALVQTAVVLNKKCPDRESWMDHFDSPPMDFASWANGIDLGNAPWQCQSAVKKSPVYALLPEAPGENTMKKSADIMMWKEACITELRHSEALIAVIADQFWGLPSGAGHRGGCRGQNPLTIMVEPDEFDAPLWKRVWLNVFPADEWKLVTKSPAVEIPFEFPWKRPRQTGPVTPANANALEMLWQMPRRWRIIQDADGFVRTMVLEGGGIAYEGWLHHPLTAYRALKDKPGEYSTVKTNISLGFQEWASLAVGIDSSHVRIPSVVNAYIEDMRSLFAERPFRLRCFGWASGDFGPAAWTESVVPFYTAVDHAPIEEAVNAATQANFRLKLNLGQIEKFLAIEADKLYREVEGEFYSRVKNGEWAGWSQYVKKTAIKIFWDTAEFHNFDPYKTALMVKMMFTPPKTSGAKKKD